MNDISIPTITPVPNNFDALWMPFTANRAYKSSPRLLARAEGMHYYTPDGRELIDGTAGLWCVNAGHGRREITEAIQRQAATMDFAPTFQLGHPIVFQAAAKVAELTPPGLDRVFFTNSGSESADTALKIALAYHRSRGEAGRVRLIGRERAYHGVGFGGMSVGGIPNNRKQFGAHAPLRRPSAAHPRSGAQRVQPRLAGMGHAPRGRARKPGRAAWRRDDRGGDGRADRRLDGRADPAARLSRLGCARSATATASC